MLDSIMKLKVLLKVLWKFVGAVGNKGPSRVYFGRERNFSMIRVSGSPL
jgi:hypothetical protein